MANCAYCGTSILFGGRRVGELRYCNATCQQRANLLAWSQQVPAPVVQQQVMSVHQGRCPQCSGPGPVDVHTSYRVFSALIITRWMNTPQVSCRSCGVKKQLIGVGYSLLLGWWGFPWGLIMTPVQIVRNISGMVSVQDPTRPSAQLERTLRVTIGAQAARAAAPAQPARV
jgi:hypothetical protein